MTRTGMGRCEWRNVSSINRDNQGENLISRGVRVATSNPVYTIFYSGLVSFEILRGVDSFLWTRYYPTNLRENLIGDFD